MASSLTSDLLKAVRLDDAASIAALLNSAPRTKIHEKRALKMLIESVERDKLAATQALLSWGVDANAEYGNDLLTPLVQAARKNSIEAARLLLGAGADASKEGSCGWTPLHEARTREMATLLLDAGADIEAIGSRNSAPLWWACVREWDEVALLLIERGANIEPPDCSPLCGAIYSARERLVETLLARGARVLREAPDPPFVFDALDWARRGNPMNTPVVNARIVEMVEEAAARQGS